MRRYPAAVTLVLAIAFVACGGGGDDDDDPTPAPTSVETADTTPNTPSGEIRSIELDQTPVVEAFVTEMGGTYVQGNVLYADVTGDSVEDAVVPVSSGGTLGDVAMIVLTPEGDSVAEVLTVDAREFGITATVDDGVLVTVEPVPGPDDPFCCPSQVRTTTYTGDGGTGLTVESSVVGPNPAGAETPETQED